jgi:hypothetical protein
MRGVKVYAPMTKSVIHARGCSTLKSRISRDRRPVIASAPFPNRAYDEGGTQCAFELFW